MEVAETKIDAAAAKNAQGVPHGVKERPRAVKAVMDV